MFDWFRRWQHARILARSPHSAAQWQQSVRQLPLLSRLSDTQRQHLIELATVFLHRKHISGAADLVLTDAMCRSIALQACLPILNLGLDWYEGWKSIIVYPDAFYRSASQTDEFGIVHDDERELSGEAWQQGPVILSWRDASVSGFLDGHNVVIHEFVHKLDMLNGYPNGFPPMPAAMDATHWSSIMNAAFEDFQQHPRPGLDGYGATDPAEFFAVMSEVFFETPVHLHDAYPQVYELLREFFGQHPLSRLQ